MTSLRGPGERNFNAVSHKPTRAPIQSVPVAPVSFGLWDTALKFLSPGPRSDVTDHLVSILPLQYRLSKPGPGSNIKFLPEVESVRKAVEELKQQNINKIIAVGHAGIEMDKQIAKEVDGVDIVVGGHTNTFLYTGTKAIVKRTKKGATLPQHEPKSKLPGW